MQVDTAKVLGIFNVALYGLIVVTTLVFIHGSDHHNLFSRGGERERAVGWICAVFSVSVFAAPLSVMVRLSHIKELLFSIFAHVFVLYKYVYM